MDLKEEYNTIVNFLILQAKENGETLSKTEIAAFLKMNRSYFSGLLGGSEEIKDYHLDTIKTAYSSQLGMGENAALNALLNILLKEFAALKVKVDGEGSTKKIIREIKSKASEALISLKAWQK